MLAALAIALAARRFVVRHIDAVAMLRCLGLTQSEVTSLYVLEFLIVGFSGSAIGVAFGLGAHYVLLHWLGNFLVGDLPPPGALPALQGLAIGLLLLLGFALPPLLQLRNVPHNQVVRREASPPKAFTLAGYAMALVAFVSLLIWQTGELKLGLLTAASFLIGCAAFSLIAWALLRGLRWVRLPSGFATWRFAQASLQRQPASTTVQIVALALGLMALLLLSVVRQDLLSAWRLATPANAPNHFVINIQPEQRSEIQALLETKGIANPILYPMIRGRLIQVNQRSLGPEVYPDERAQRLIEREFNLSTMADLPVNNQLVEGAWFTPGPKFQASVEQGIAKTLGLKLGDQLRFEVAGVPIEAEISSIRKLDWGSMRVNFFVILNPPAAAALPATWITAVHIPDQSAGIVNLMVRRFPNLTIVDVGSVLAQLQQTIDQVVGAVEFLFLFTLAAGVLVLSAALLVSQQERKMESALLRALGATRSQLARAQWLECLLVGSCAGLMAAGAAGLVGWVLARQVFEFEWSFSPMLFVMGIAVGVFSSLLGGWISLRSVLSRPPILTLREA
jgi:putative ABC transport system permease protein